MRLTIVGAGYVGLVSGACFADFGHDVICVDTDRTKIRSLKNGIMPIYEPGLEDLVRKNVESHRLSFSDDLAESVQDRDAIFIAVGTPSRRGDGHADLSFVYKAAHDIAVAVQSPTIIITKSTVPVGTGDRVEDIMKDVRPELDLPVVSNPEFLREGAAINDFKRPDRIVVGANDDHARDVMKEIYRPLYLNEPNFVFTDRRTSELIKYAANAFLAVKVTFINELADLCEQVNADVQDIAKGIGLDNRIGAKFLHPGPGFGGSCFPKDLQALAKTAQDSVSPMRIVETVIAVNDQRKRAMARKVIAACKGSVRGKKIAILGLAFKPNTDDMRDAPSLAIITALQDAGAVICAYDPEAMAQAREMMHGVDFAENAYACAEGADALVIVTEWDMFRALDLKRIKTLLNTPNIVDLRNIYSPKTMTEIGLQYFGVGRSSAR